MSAANRPPLPLQLVRAARYPIAPGSWDLLLRTCSLSALASLAVSILFPAISDLAAFFTLMLIACGPTSAFLPAASEPVLIAFGRLYQPLMLAGIGVVAVVVVEFLNYSLFDAILSSNKLRRVREAKCTRLVIRWFETQPFLTVSVSAFSPVPFWIARTCAVLSRYSLPRYVCATALGRFWRMFLIAAVGSTLPFTTKQILIGAGTLITVFAAAGLLRRLRRRPTPIRASTATPVPTPVTAG